MAKAHYKITENYSTVIGHLNILANNHITAHAMRSKYTSKSSKAAACQSDSHQYGTDELLSTTITTETTILLHFLMYVKVFPHLCAKRMIIKSCRHS